MRLLLFLISFLFSFIFYNFHLLSKGKNIFGDSTFYDLKINSISGNLIIETVSFLLIGILFIMYFTTYKAVSGKVNYNKLYYILFYFLLLIPFYFHLFDFNNTVFIFLVIFIFGDIVFNYISNIKYFSKEKLNLRYFGLILNYLVFLPSIFYIFIVDFSYYLGLIVIYSIIFNFNIHRKYSNYISLFLSIIGILLSIYFLFLKIKEFYIVLF